jgi:Mn-dependent DtxR family transcriptional regulator
MVKYYQPTPSLRLVACGFRRGTVNKVLRETNRDGLTFERYHLYRVTEQGLEIIKLLLKDSRVLEWINNSSNDFEWIEPEISHRNVTELK